MFKSNTNGLDSLKQKLVKTITFASIGVLFALSLMALRQGQVQGAPSTTLNFQARLLNNTGSLVADGNYNIQFSIYSVSSGGTALWTETYLNSASQGVTIKNGFLSVRLGTIDSLADESDINWNEELWLGMTVRGTGSCSFGSCTPADSEMTPRMKITAIPYAFQANQLAETNGANRSTLGFTTITGNRSILLPDASGTVCLQNAASCGFLTGTASDYIQNGTTQQTNANFNIFASSGVAATIQGASGQNIFVLNQNGGSAALTVASTGNVTLAADLAVNGGDITSSGALNITPGGALIVGATGQTATLQGSTATITSNGSGNDITLTSADQIILNATTGGVDLNGTVAVGNNTTPHSQYALRVDHVIGDGAGGGTGCGFFGCVGVRSSITLNNPPSPDQGAAFYGQVGTTASSSTTLDRAYAFYAANTGVGLFTTVNNGYGLFVEGQTAATNNAGVLIGETSSASGKAVNLLLGGSNFSSVPASGAYSIFNQSTDANYFAGALGIGDTTPDALFTVGATSQFQVNSSGAIAAATGVTSSGTITFSGLDCSGNTNGGAITANASGVLSCTDDNDTAASTTFQDIYDNSNPASFTLNSTNGGLLVKDASTTIGGTLFAVQDNAGSTNYLQVTTSGISVAGGGTLTGNLTVQGTGTSSVAGAFTVAGNTTLGDANTDTLTITGTAVTLPNNLNFDSNTLYVDAANNRVGIGNASPSQTLDVTGNAKVSGVTLLGDTAAIDSNLPTSLILNETFVSGDGCVFGCYGGRIIATGNNTTGGLVGVTTGVAITAGNASAAYGLIANNVSLSGGGTVTDAIGISIAAQTSGTNNAGLVIGETTGTKAVNLLINPAAGTTPLTNQPAGAYSIYNASTDQNYFAGALGIGDSTPDARLDVEPTGAVTATSYAQRIENLQTNTTTNGIDKYGLHITSTGSFTGGAGTATNNYGLFVATPTGADNNYAAVFQGGNVGIGTTAPSSLLSVGSTSQFQVNSAGAIAAATGVTSSGTITFSGLNCSANANGGAITANASGVLSCSDDNDTTANAFLQGGNDFGANAVLGTTQAGQTLTFITANTTRLTLDTTGNATLTGRFTAQGGLTVTGNTINLNDSSNFNTNINTGTSTGSVSIGNNTGNTSIFINSGTGSINIGTGTQTKTLNIANGGGTQTIHLGSTTSTSQTNIYAGENNINLLPSGSSNTGVVIRPSTNSTNALLIQKSSASDTLFRADTTNNRLYVGNAAASSGTDSTLLIVDSASTANLPTGVNGGIIYDTTDGKFKIFEAGAYKEVCNMTDLGCGAGASADLQDVYDNSGTPALITTSSATKDVILRSGVGFNSASIFQIQNASSQNVFVADTVNQRVAVGPAAVPANGVLTVGTNTTAASGGIFFGTDTNLFRSASNTLRTNDAFTVDGLLTGSAGAAVSGAAISLNASSNFATNINTGTSTGAVTIGNNTGNTAVTIDSGTAAINIGAGGQARAVNVATGAAAQTLTIGSTNTSSTTLIQGGTGNITLTALGSSNTGTVVGNTNNSTNAFRIQSSGSDVLFRADTTNNRVYVGNATASSGADSTLLVIDSASTANLPTGVNGGIIYDSTTNKFKIYEDGAWKILCNTTDLGCGVAGQNQTLQDAYDNSSPATVETTSATKDIIFKSGSGFDSTGIFQIQDSGADVLFRADTTNNRVYVGNATASSGADSTLLVIDSASTSNLPTGVNGGVIYDSTDNKFKVYENGAWKTLCNQTDLGCGSAGVSQTLQDAYNNSASPAIIETSSATKNLIIRSGDGFNSTGAFQIQDADDTTLFVADTVNQRVAIGDAVSPANGVLTVGGNTTAASGGIYFGTDTNLYRSAAGTLRTDGNLQLGEGGDRTFDVQGRTTNAAGNGLTISAGDAGTGGSAFGGGTLTLQGGDAAGTGDANGGNIILTGGAGVGNGARGLVVIGTPTFTTTLDDANCFTSGSLVASSCTIAASSVSNSSAIVVGFSMDGQIATLPDPVNTTAGRIIYITGANGSSDFTLSVNGGGQGNEIAMKANTSATMIWNGSDWTAAGASSSTTLQAAYNNTLTSAGGAEIVLNNTASSNGLTVRNNSSNPITGGLFEIQSSIGTNLFSVNNRGTELAANGGSETEDTWTTNWTAVGGATASRSTTSGEFVTGTAGVEVITSAVADDGIKNNLSGNPVNTIGAEYQVSFAAKSSINGTPIEVVYSRDGGTTETACTNYGAAGAQNLSDTEWTKLTCTITIDSATAATNPDLIIRKTDTSTPTIWIDNLSFMRNDLTTAPSNVQVGGGIDGGPITLFTLDRASAPPVADGDTTYLGSMYYDTITGRIQCYESDGWGACGSAPDNFVNLVPEYPGAVLNGSGVGTMTADFCSNSGTLSVNSSLCASGQALNFYRWTSPQATQQTYSIYVTYQLPAAFKYFQDDNTVALTARTDSTTNGVVTYEMFRSEGGSLVACGTETTVTTSANLWQTVGINGNENSGCGFSTSSANSNVIFKINVKANSNANVYVGTLSFTTIGQ